METPSLLKPGDHADLTAWDWRIILGSLKGGVGKSTSAWMMLWALARRLREPVLGVCADPKSQSLSDSYRVAQSLGVKVPFFVQHWPNEEGMVEGVRAEMEKLGARHVVLDTGGEGGQGELILEQACMLGDELILPTAPNQADMRRIPATLQVAARVAHLHATTPNILLTSCKTSANDQTAARNWLTAPNREWPVFKAFAPDTVLYTRALFKEPDSVGIYDYVLDELAAQRAED